MNLKSDQITLALFLFFYFVVFFHYYFSLFFLFCLLPYASYISSLSNFLLLALAFFVLFFLLFSCLFNIFPSHKNWKLIVNPQLPSSHRYDDKCYWTSNTQTSHVIRAISLIGFDHNSYRFSTQRKKYWKTERVGTKSELTLTYLSFSLSLSLYLPFIFSLRTNKHKHKGRFDELCVGVFFWMNVLNLSLFPLRFAFAVTFAFSLVSSSSNNNIHNIIGIALTNYSLPHAFFSFYFSCDVVFWQTFTPFLCKSSLSLSILSILMFHSKFGHSE